MSFVIFMNWMDGLVVGSVFIDSVLFILFYTRFKNDKFSTLFNIRLIINRKENQILSNLKKVSVEAVAFSWSITIRYN